MELQSYYGNDVHTIRRNGSSTVCLYSMTIVARHILNWMLCISKYALTTQFFATVCLFVFCFLLEVFIFLKFGSFKLTAFLNQYLTNKYDCDVYILQVQIVFTICLQAYVWKGIGGGRTAYRSVLQKQCIALQLQRKWALWKKHLETSSMRIWKTVGLFHNLSRNY